MGWAILAAAHAAVQALEAFRDHPDTQEWLEQFKKVVCVVSNEQFEKAKTYGRPHIIYSDEDYG